MAISILTSPQLISPVYNPIFTKVSSTQTTQEAFSFVFDLYVNGTFVNRDRLLPRPGTTQAIYSPARILESYVTYDKTHNIVLETPSINCIDKYEIIFGEEYINPWAYTSHRAITGGTFNTYTEFYSTGATANPYVSGDTIYVVQNSGYTSNIYGGVFSVISATTSSVIVDMIHLVNTPINGGTIVYSDRRKTIYTAATITSGYSFNGVIQYEEVPSWDYTDYTLNKTTSKFLTNQPSTVKAKLVDRGSIGCMNNYIHPVGENPNGFLVIGGTSIGGAARIPLTFDLSYLGVANSLTNRRIIEFPAYPYNLNVLSQSVYVIDVIDSTSETYTLTIYDRDLNQVSETKTFEVDHSCSKYEDVRFMFLNSLGQFDYFTANLVSKETVNITKTTYQKALDYNYVVGDRGKTVISTDAQQSYVVTSNWITEETLAWLNELFLSTEVYILNNSTGALTPVIVDNTSFEPKKRVNDGLLNQVFNYTKAVKKNTLRG